MSHLFWPWADKVIKGNETDFSATKSLKEADMQGMTYHLEYTEGSYCVTCETGVVAVFSRLDDAFDAMKKFQDRPQAEAWQKIPPSMRAAKVRLGQS